MAAPSEILAVGNTAIPSGEIEVLPGESQSFGMKGLISNELKERDVLLILQIKDDEGNWHEMPGKKLYLANRLFSIFEPGTWRIKRMEGVMVGVFKTH